MASSSSPILITGETGTGKEVFAQSIHNYGQNQAHPFVAVNCAAIPEHLLESLLFGTVKGSFTGSTNLKGLFEQAANGALFLDEINSMPIALQAKLLRVLQEKSVRRIGGTNEIPVNCRVISSCSEDPEQCVINGNLRKDLYYRLAIIRINIPPLRERGTDIIGLAEFFIGKFAPLYGKDGIRFSDDFRVFISRYNWPGNVRELEYTLESCVAMLDDDEDELTIQNLPSHLRSKVYQGDIQAITSTNTTTLADALKEVERKVIIKSLEDHDWNIASSARAIGIGRQNMQYRIRKLGIEKTGSKPK